MPMVYIKTKDNRIIPFKDSYIAQTFLIKDIMESTILLEPIPININSISLDGVLKFMEINTQIVEKHYDLTEIRMTKIQKTFFESLSTDDLCDLLNTANYLYVPVLLEMAAQFIAQAMQEKPIEDLKSMFHTSSDFRSKQTEFEWMSSSENET